MRLLLLFTGFHASRKLIGLLLHTGEVLSDILHANFLEAFAARHDAVIKGNIRVAAVHFMHFKSLGAFLGYVQTVAIAIGSEEHVVVEVSIHGLREDLVEEALSTCWA